MAKNLGKEVRSVYDGLGYAYDKVFFQKGKPPLDHELNDSQQFQELITQKSTAHLPSGWLSNRPFYTSPDLVNSFYTQDLESPKPEVALVNGWPIYVTNTNTPSMHVNEINLSDFELRSGNRVDGVFLEVWRSLIAPQQEDTQATNSKPQPIRRVNNINSVFMLDDSTGWACGNNGVMLKTTDGGINWVSKEVPVSTNFKKVKFLDAGLGYMVGVNGHVLKSINGGETWVSLDTPVNDALNDVAIIDSNTVIIVGDNGTILRSIDGSNFYLVEQTSGTSNTLNSVFFFDSVVGWIAGVSGSFLITNDAGMSWQAITIENLATGEPYTDDFNSVAFYNLNDGLLAGENGIILKSTDGGRNWADMTDRIWTGTEYKTLAEIWPTRDNALNDLFIKREFPLIFNIQVYAPSKNLFNNAIYKISPPNYPNSFVLEWIGSLDNRSYLKVLDLDNYATAEELASAINALMSPYQASDVTLPDEDRQKARVFQASVDFAPITKPSDLRPSAGAISSKSSTEISFSIEDRAWIVGSDGLLLTTVNSGAKWNIVDTGLGIDLYGSHYVQNNLGWLVGAEGFVVKDDPANESEDFVQQDTDLVVKTKERIFPEGNILSDAEDYLEDDMLDPNINRETSKRVQIQYRIRVVDGVDPFGYPESGLGAQFVYSLGPNATTIQSGSYSYENMGKENGDYGLWRSRCRNTFDGYSWAIPMFFVTRRNSSPFNVESNINGSTVKDLNAIRPDGLVYEQIIDDDIVDIRRKININSYSHLLEKNFDLLQLNALRTKLNNRDNRGSQFGTSILTTDTYTGISAINNLASGGVTSEAQLIEDVKTLDPNIDLTEAELTFGPRDKGLYHNDPAFYKAVIVRDGNETTEPVQGTYQGLGTNRVTFVRGDNNLVEEGIQYKFTATYIDFSRRGLSRVPQEPMGIKYLPDDINNSLFYRGISSRVASDRIEWMKERVSGYRDYTLIYSAQRILDNKEDEDLYKSLGFADRSSAIYARSLRKFKGQQFRASLVEYHYFMRVEETTRILRVPKNLDGYGVYGVRSVTGVNGSVHKLSSDYEGEEGLRDREQTDTGIDDTNLLIYLDSAFVVPSGAIIEIVLDVVSTDSASTDDKLGLTVVNKGESLDALRNPFTSNYHVGSKTIEGMYKCVLYPINPEEDILQDSNSFTIDLANPKPGYPELQGGVILGIGTFQTNDRINQPYVWYLRDDGPAYYRSIPVETIDGFGTSEVSFKIDDRVSVESGEIFVPLLVQQVTVQNLSDTAVAHVLYKYRPYQTIQNLPSTLKVEIMKSFEFVYISNLGTGQTANIKGEPYEVPIENIPVNDPDFINENMYSTIDDLDFLNFSIDSGYVKMPASISRMLGKDVTFSKPNNVGDKLGRTFYTESSEDFRIQAEGMSIATPRKVYVPMVGRIRSDITSPFIRGELVLIVVSKSFKARSENETGFFEDENIEYEPGYTEIADPSVAIYRMTNKPIVRM